GRQGIRVLEEGGHPNVRLGRVTKRQNRETIPRRSTIGRRYGKGAKARRLRRGPGGLGGARAPRWFVRRRPGGRAPSSAGGQARRLRRGPGGPGRARAR